MADFVHMARCLTPLTSVEGSWEVKRKEGRAKEGNPSLLLISEVKHSHHQSRTMKRRVE
jgi:hypothetical protein